MNEPTIWEGCYDAGWQDLLTPDAFSHPAKMARGLVFRIISHLLDNGLIQPGQTVLDPFGGVGTTALPTLLAGLNYVGVELEPKFVELGRANIEMWQRKFSRMPKWSGNAVLLQGDSRRLVEVIAEAGGVVGSPPYAEQQSGGTAIWDKMEEYHDRKFTDKSGRKSGYQEQGDTPGQLAALPPGNLSAVVGSPPFAGNSGGCGEASRNGIDPGLFDRHQGGMVGGVGETPGNLAGMTPGDVAGVVGSPPYSDSNVGNGDGENELRRLQEKAARGELKGEHLRLARQGRLSPHENANLSHYGSTPGNIGNDSGTTFWAAAAEILRQCAAVLPPGAPAVWVVKSFVKGGKLVDFPDQWRQLCEASGFETVEVIHAMQTKNAHTVVTLDGKRIKKATRRASFFRLLAEKKGAPVIDHETVLVTVRRG